MAILNLDFSTATTDEVIPEGDYTVSVDQVEAKPSSSNDALNLNWRFTITSGPQAGRKLFQTTNTSQKAMFKLVQTLHALGVETEGLQMATDDASNLVIQPRLAGLVALATVKHRTWQDRKMADVTLKKMNGASPNGGQQFR